jgi:hypothetical protein
MCIPTMSTIEAFRRAYRLLNDHSKPLALKQTTPLAVAWNANSRFFAGDEFFESCASLFASEEFNPGRLCAQNCQTLQMLLDAVVENVLDCFEKVRPGFKARFLTPGKSRRNVNRSTWGAFAPASPVPSGSGSDESLFLSAAHPPVHGSGLALPLPPLGGDRSRPPAQGTDAPPPPPPTPEFEGDGLPPPPPPPPEFRPPPPGMSDPGVPRKPNPPPPERHGQCTGSGSRMWRHRRQSGRISTMRRSRSAQSRS